MSGTPSTKTSWNGEFYASYGPDGHRSWADAVQYRFIPVEAADGTATRCACCILAIGSGSRCRGAAT